MDLSVLHTLEFDKIREMLAQRTGSVLGRELAGALLPVSDAGAVSRRIAETQEATQVLMTAMNVPLGGIRDIRVSLKKARVGGILEPAEIVGVGGTLYASRRMKTFFKELTVSAPVLASQSEGIAVLRNIENLIEHTINEQGAIRDDASVELQRLRREIKQSQARIKDKLDSILRSTEYQKYFQDVLVTMRGDRYVIPIKQEYRHNFPGIVHDQSSSGATVFIEPMAIVNLNNDIKQLLSAEKNEIERILQMVSAQIAVNADSIQGNCEILAQLDFAFAKARLGLDMQAVMPELNDQGIVQLRQARHPLIPGDIVVPVDVTLGDKFHTLLITGPNTGGKTVTMKTLGLFALMTQAGLFIPALSGSQMPVFQHVFADIGDEQSIEQSLSTFSAHMTNIVRILNRVSANDLVLIDEVGAGTDPEEGAALAMAILEYLMNSGAKTIATTHYSELKTFAYSRSGIENASVEFDIQTLRPTYRLLIGIPGSSNAFAISGRLGLSPEIINRARQLIDKDHAEFEDVLNDLEAQKINYESLNRQARAQQSELTNLRNHLAKEQQELIKKKDQMLTKAQSDAAVLIRQARREAESVIAELKAQFQNENSKARQQAIDGARRVLKESLGALAAEPDFSAMPAVSPEALAPNSQVFVTSLNQTGSVITASQDQVTVQIGLMKVNVPLSSCRLVKGEPAAVSKANSKPLSFAKVYDVPRQIDVRGTNVEEAEILLAKYLDDAILAGLHQVLVIHGKGTGALRKGVRAYLKNHHHVKDISIGELNEGGDGATAVRLI
ncbi:endonuclease MutS2|uniref:Endonuclease MutS2 n=1 Tax=Dendrosporobacter quercicolus TaxID=146817 RepID=A0A1G9KLA0_9FIRM|nr:endonuclease MutS2 [Dendrosporobacter quercicolus]NSL46440.1 endonuclease MutS2 [Dendrosporobacter quercicolus DSM 1736]SDL50439.1 DNA mismatch repair protein MutS2 [Dendrosporobacter quercicolus]